MPDRDAGDWLKLEQAEAKRDGAVSVKNSGRSRTTKKGDSVLGDFVVDYKFTEKSFTLNTAVWAKISLDAWKNGNRAPAIKVIMLNDKSPVRVWVVSDTIMQDYLRLRRLEDGESE